MNASPQQNPSQGSADLEKTGMVLNYAEAKLKAELKKGGIDAAAKVAAPYILKAREVSLVNSKHQELMDMPVEVQDEFVDHLASQTVDQAWYNSFLKRFKMLLPAGVIYITYEDAKNGTLALMLLTGMIGDARMQERFAERAEPGFVERLLAKALPLIVKFDMEPDSRLMLEALIKIMQVKGLSLEALRALRKAVHAAEVSGNVADLETMMEDVEDLANYAARMPADADHKEPNQVNVDNALGPDSQAA